MPSNSGKTGFLRALLDNPIVGIYVLQKGLFRYANHALRKILGYEELVGRLGLVDIVRSDHKDVLEDEIERVLKGEIGSLHRDLPFVRGDGGHIWCEVYGKRVSYDANVAVAGFIVELGPAKGSFLTDCIVNISRSLLAGASLEDTAREVLRKAIELTGARAGFVSVVDEERAKEIRLFFEGPDVSFCKLPAGRTLEFKREKDGKFRGLWGHSINERKPFFTNEPSSHPSSKGLPKGHIPISNFLSVPVIAESEFLGQIALANKEGGFSEEDLELIGKLALLYGLSIRREREIGILRRSEVRFRVLAESSLTGVFIESEGRIVFANSGFSSMLGYAPEEILGRSLLDFIHPDYRAYVMNVVKEYVFRRKIPAELELKFLRKRGEGWCRAFLVGIVHGGKPSLMGNVVDTTERKELEGRLRESLKRLKKNLEGTIKAFASTVEKRDPYTAGHQRKVAELSREIAKGLGLLSDEVDGVYFAALVHDIGKIAVPSEILSKPGRLTEIEFEFLKIHPQVGYEILKDIEFPWPVADMVLQHHERLDGSGYPKGLRDGKIILGARIIAVADVVEAMSSHRPYRPALGVDKALSEIESGKGKLYDPDVVDTCIKLFREKGFTFSPVQ